MHRKWLMAAIVLAVLPLSAADVKLGYIYSDQILKDFKGMSEPNAALVKEKTNFKQRADSLYGILAKAKADFESQKLLLSEEGKAAKSSEISGLQSQYDGYVRDVYGPNGKLEQKTQELMGPIIQKIRDAVDTIAKGEGYSMVFDASESQMAILYAAPGYNLTSEVLDEINREYVPVATPGVLKKHYAVAPLSELNNDAQQINLGEQARSLIYAIIEGEPKTEMVPSADLSSAMTNKGVSAKSNLTDQMIYDLGKSVQADYVVYGTVTLTGKRITVTLKVADPRLNKTYPPQNGEANRQDELNTTLANLVASLMKQLPE